MAVFFVFFLAAAAANQFDDLVFGSPSAIGA